MFVPVNMPFDKQDRIMIKNFYLLTGYIVQQYLREFPSKKWNK